MLLKRTLTIVALAQMLLLAGTLSYGQGLEGMQLFAPADTSSFGKGPQANEGYFFSIDALYWTISAPNVTTIGHPNLTRQTYTGEDPDTGSNAPFLLIQSNSLNTGFLDAAWTPGDRIEFGRVSENRGWFCSIYQMRDLGQTFTSSGVAVVFDDPVYGPNNLHRLDGIAGIQTSTGKGNIVPLPVTFTTMLVQDVLSTWGVELNYLGRSNEFHNGAYFEWFAGPRYIQFYDDFLVDGRGGSLDASNWATSAQNHIIAGQVGGRLFKKVGRWMLSTEGRFLAGENYQTIHQSGLLGSELTPLSSGGIIGKPISMEPTSINNSVNYNEFTTGVELRVDARYQMTRSVSFRAGWTGVWMDNIARSPDMINYTLPNMGILPDTNRQNLFMNGLTIGIDVNR